MRVEIEPDLSAFAADALPWLRTTGITANVPAVTIRERLDGLVAPEPDALWLRVVGPDGLAGVAVHTPPKLLLLPDLPEEAVVALADAVWELRPGIPGVIGPRASAGCFAARWSVRSGAAARIKTTCTIYELSEPVMPTGVRGRAREATPADRELLADWHAAFARDVHSPVERGRDERLALADRRIAHGGAAWLWAVGDTPVSLSIRTEPVEGVSRVAMVYTPPEHRGNGYAAASVAELCRSLLALPEVERCMLYADTGNPTSNGVYRRIGFEPVAESVDYLFG